MLNEFEKLENALVRAGRELEFPPTPAIAARVRAELALPAPQNAGNAWRRIRVPLALAIVLALALLLTLPAARDAVAQFLGLPQLRIFYVTPTPTPTATPTARPSAVSAASLFTPTRAPVKQSVTPTATKTATPTIQPYTPCCVVTLDEAKQKAHFKLLTPPNQTPSQVSYQNVYDAGEQIVMVFGDLAKPSFTLYQAQRWVYGKVLGNEVGAQTQLAETLVKGERAFWFSGAPHLVMMVDAHGEPIYDSARTVDANTLVWETGDDYSGVIYRLETRMPLEDAVKIAESLTQVP